MMILINHIGTLIGRTALMHAASGGSKDIVQLLLSSGADVNAVDQLGRTPLMYAAKGKAVELDDESCLECVKLLLENHADPEIMDSSGMSALDHAMVGDVLMGNQFVDEHIVALLSK